MIPSSTDGVNYYRMAAWAFEMRKYRGVTVTLPWFKYCIDASKPHPWQEDLRSSAMSFDAPGLTVGQYIRAVIDRTCEISDVVLWHPMYYEWSLDFFLEMQHKHQKPFIVEVDDNYVDVPSWNEAYHSFRNGSSYRRISLDSMRNAEAMIVTTPHLKEVYSSVNENVYVVPNSLDFKGDRKFVGWDKVSVRKHKGLRIGWIGGRSHFTDLMMVAPPLASLLRERKDVTLCLVNSAIKQSCSALKKEYPFEGLKNVLVADRSVPINRYASFMASFGFDIGIAPLVDCNFNRSKSNLRWLEYSALKIPCVASSVDHFTSSIDHGETGFLVAANSFHWWKRYISDLLETPALRDHVGRNAYKAVRRDYNIERNAAAYFRLLKSIANVGRITEHEGDLVAI